MPPARAGYSNLNSGRCRALGRMIRPCLSVSRRWIYSYVGKMPFYSVAKLLDGSKVHLKSLKSLDSVELLVLGGHLLLCLHLSLNGYLFLFVLMTEELDLRFQILLVGGSISEESKLIGSELIGLGLVEFL